MNKNKSKIIEEINVALNTLNDIKDTYSFIGTSSNNNDEIIKEYFMTTLDDINEIKNACYEVKTLIKRYLKGI